LLDGFVYTIDLARELELVIALRVRGRVEDLVDVLGARKAGDSDLGDVLYSED